MTKNRDNDRPVQVGYHPHIRLAMPTLLEQFYEFGAFQSESATIDIWATNSTLVERNAVLELSCLDLESDWRHVESHNVLLQPNQTTELLSISVPEPHPESADAHTRSRTSPTTRSYSVVVHARLVDATTKEVLSRFSDWPQPYRFIDFPALAEDVHIDIDHERISIHVDKPVKGLVLSVKVSDGKDEENGEVKWSDNNLDLVPGDNQEVVARGLKGRKIGYRMMGRESIEYV